MLTRHSWMLEAKHLGMAGRRWYIRPLDSGRIAILGRTFVEMHSQVLCTLEEVVHRFCHRQIEGRGMLKEGALGTCSKVTDSDRLHRPIFLDDPRRCWGRYKDVLHRVYAVHRLTNHNVSLLVQDYTSAARAHSQHLFIVTQDRPSSLLAADQQSHLLRPPRLLQTPLSPSLA